MRPNTRIIIFAKAPIPGFCKTRLIETLGAERAASLAANMLLHTIDIARQADLGPIELCVAPEPDHACFRALAIGPEVSWSCQSEGDLGGRMATAVQRGIADGQHVLCIGTDCLALTATHLRAASAALEYDEAVIIPALDGGYVLIGLSQFDLSIFQDITWSTNTVFAETMQRLALLGWHVTQLEALRDIDEPADLSFLPALFTY